LCRDAAQIVVGGLVLVFIYCGSDWEAEPSFVKWAQELPEGATGQGMVWLAEHMRIFSNAGVGLARQISHNVRGHGAYLLGRTDPRALWYYFPVLLTIKLSLPLLLAVVLLAVFRPQALLNWACLASAALILFSFICRVQLGIRLVLPLVTLAVVGLAAAIVQTWGTQGPRWQRALFRTVPAVGLLWMAASALAVWPHGLCFVNELWGGTARGYRLVSDTNYDWGQGLKELAGWQREHKLAVLDVWYFGADPALTRMRLHSVPLHQKAVHNPGELTACLQGRYLAVSTTLLYGVSYDPAHRESAAFLRTCRPIDRTSTFLIYEFP
jgi:hypothetical protein